jgi:3-oxoadipate enol-lactonase
VFKFKHQGEALHYRLRGRGEYLLLIHGLGSSGADWEWQARALEHHFRVLTPDLPGSGYSPPICGKYSIADMARSLWALLDHLQASRVNIIGFSLGGAVALEMALQRPQCVPRLALINSLASYRIDHWRKWLEARIPPTLIRALGMRRVAWLTAARLFPQPWQRPLRDRAAETIGAVPAGVYLAMASALEGWTSIERLHRLSSKTLIIAAEHDYTPLQEKHALAAALKAQIVVVRGSRHGTPFDAVEATNACLLALLTDRPMPPSERCVCDAASAILDLCPQPAPASNRRRRPAPARARPMRLPWRLLSPRSTDPEFN